MKPLASERRLRYSFSMNELFDILFFAALAAFFFSRLWSVMGRRDDSDGSAGGRAGWPEPKNPFAPKTKEPSAEGIIIPGKVRDVTSDVLSENGFAKDSLAGALDRLRATDPFFDERAFLQGAKTAFRQIVDSFAKGSLSSVDRLLSPSVKASFEQAMDPDASPQTEARVVDITDAALSDVKLQSTEVRLTVDFTSLQRPPSAQGQTIEMHDRWVFSRDSTSANPNWVLVATSV